MRRVLCGLLVLAAAGCSGGTSADPSPSAPTRSASGSFATGAPATPDSVTAEPDVTGGPGTAAERRAFTQFLRWRVVLINGGEAPQLSSVATQAQVDAAVETQSLAEQRGWALPSQPRAAVVSASGGGKARVLAVCLWLPSTEYVVADTGKPVGGRVLHAWKPAEVTLAGSRSDPRIATVRAPRHAHDVDCKGLTP